MPPYNEPANLEVLHKRLEATRSRRSPIELTHLRNGGNRIASAEIESSTGIPYNQLHPEVLNRVTNHSLYRNVEESIFITPPGYKSQMEYIDWAFRDPGYPGHVDNENYPGWAGREMPIEYINERGNIRGRRPHEEEEKRSLGEKGQRRRSTERIRSEEEKQTLKARPS